MAIDRPMFPKIKFCGFTRPEDVIAAIELRVDAIGLNFYPESPRHVSIERGAELSALACGKVCRVGVFVNASPETVVKTLETCPLDVVQLHGEESIDWLEQARSIVELQEIKIWKAIVWRGESYPKDEVHAWGWASHPRLSCLLVDAYDPLQRGGTGKTARWDLLQPKPKAFGRLPYLLAGGLRPENLAQAIQTAAPDGIDIASGIEVSPGIKCQRRMEQVCLLARDLLA